MMLEELQTAISGLPEEEFDRLKSWIVIGETQRRAALPLVEEAKQDAARQVWEQAPTLKPRYTLDADVEVAPEWVKPPSWIKGYPPKARVSHRGQVWVNALGTMNITEPGESSAWTPKQQADKPAATDSLPPHAPSGDAAPVENSASEPQDEPVAGIAPARVIPEWKTGVNYVPGKIITYQGATYRVLAEHRAGMTSPPPTAPNLYAPES